MEVIKTKPLANDFFSPHPDSAVYHHRSDDILGLIDPVLGASSSYYEQRYTPNRDFGIRRYLLEQPSCLVDAGQTPLAHGISHMDVYPGASMSFSAGQYARQESPFSYQHSSVISGTQSPPMTDNDAYGDSTQDPPTPSDLALMSPRITCWDPHQSPRYTLDRLSRLSPDACVNPASIQSGSGHFLAHGDGKSSGGFSLDWETAFGDSATAQGYYLGKDTSQSSSFNNFDRKIVEAIDEAQIDSEIQVAVAYPKLEDMENDTPPYFPRMSPPSAHRALESPNKRCKRREQPNLPYPSRRLHVGADRDLPMPRLHVWAGMDRLNVTLLYMIR